MLNFDEYQSEAQYFLDLLKVGVADREEDLMVTYIQQGPEAVRAKVGVARDESWRDIFDRLVFNGDVLMKCVVNFMPFFKNMVVEHGPLVLRDIFDIREAKYDSVFERLFDLIAVSNGALYDYAYKNRVDLFSKIKRGEGDLVREALCLTGARYDALWSEILNMLVDAVCDQILEDRMKEDGLKVIVKLFEAVREQRGI